ncbi:MAG: 50S ribosomal protein L18 [Planctomycetota bacterium]
MLRKQKKLKNKRLRVSKGVRRHVRGDAEKPRISIFRSNRQFYCQAIDDENGRTLAAVSSLKSEKKEGSRTERVVVLGQEMAERLKAIGVERAVFDRNWYRYHGVVKSFADAVRKGGIRF